MSEADDVPCKEVRQQVPLAWHTRCGLRSDPVHVPKDTSQREALARQVGADGDQLLAWRRAADPALGLRELPALEVLRQIWLQQYDRCTAPVREVLHWLIGDEQSPAAVRLASPCDLDTPYSRMRETHLVGYKVHLTETCDANYPDLITQVITTPATTQASVMGPAARQDLADRDVLPGRHLLDSGYVDADLVTAQNQHQIEVIGHPSGTYSQQRREGQGYDLQATHQRQVTGDFSVQHALQADVEGSPSQGTRRFALRRSRYRGWHARTSSCC